MDLQEQTLFPARTGLRAPRASVASRVMLASVVHLDWSAKTVMKEKKGFLAPSERTVWMAMMAAMVLTEPKESVV